MSPGAVVTGAGVPIGVGDRIATRRNDPALDLAHRGAWTVRAIGDDGALTIRENAGTRQQPAPSVRRHVQLAYATTVYGAQGETVDAAHLLLGDATNAASACVAMTRGRAHNTAHLVAESAEEARRQRIDVFARDRADLGPTHAAQVAHEDIERYGPTAPRRRPEHRTPPRPSPTGVVGVSR